MKRILGILLVISICAAMLTACEKAPEKTGVPLSVGFGKADITPTESVPLDGYNGVNAPAQRWSTTTDLPLEANCVALSDSRGTTVLVITADLLSAHMADTVRDTVSSETGIARENIIFHCTHNHSGPALRGEVNATAAVMNYIALLLENVTAAAKDALADRKPAQMHTAFTRPENCTFVRHYVLTDGSYIAYTGATLPEGETWHGHATAADDLLQLVKFTREGGKDVVLVNFQAHPCAEIEKTAVTSDYPGALRNYLRENADCEAMFIQGGAGNLATRSQLRDQKQYKDYREHAAVLGAAAVEAAKDLRQHTVAGITVLQKELLLESRDGGARKISMSAFSVGDFAMITAPFEIFDTNAMAVKESSPYAMTFYASCANGANGYLPTESIYGWRQNYEAQITSFPRGTAEQLQNAQQMLLQELFEKEGRAQPEKPEGYVREEYVPKTDGVTYWNPAVGWEGTLEPLENGYYAIMLHDGKSNKSYMVENEELAKKLVELEYMQLLFNQSNIIVGTTE